jgi:uncharacterized membrane protein YfcA
MKTHTIGMVLMLAAIGIIGFQIGATAKYQDSRYIFLLPIGICLLLIGMFFWYRDLIRAKKKDDV